MLLTPTVRALLQWFDLLYALDVSGPVPQYRRIALPMAGGVAEQPAKLLELVTWVATVRNGRLVRQVRAARAATSRRKRR